MSEVYYLFNKITKECVCLGKKTGEDGSEYTGPVCFIGDSRYYLPMKYMHLLVERFRGSSPAGTVCEVAGSELFDTASYLGPDEDVIEVGGDRDFDRPLAVYLPELEDCRVKEEIKRNGILIN
ncbi:hypothetical protein ONV78_21150 [Hahella sp. CR1]|uniref:hypothetical protein n=1 Tax=Hahella sp. CR1 TaxID=2992807 RepID=UPI002441B265|nr:hypothetical protein [Hahella sp. CR1]MDG9670259.1 hypothetical protein [Hahella sp. CR1]